MGIQAKVSSVDSIEAFRASLIIFLHKARRSLDDVSDDVRRTRAWLQTDRRTYWEGEVRKRAKILDQAEQELMSARLTGNRETAIMVRQAAVNKATRSLAEAAEKLRCVKLWNQNYDGCADPVLKRLEGLRQFLDSDLPKAVTYLVNVQRSLDAYAEGRGPEAATGAGALAPVEEQPTAKPE
jgi:hypothetical protein